MLEYFSIYKKNEEEFSISLPEDHFFIWGTDVCFLIKNNITFTISPATSIKKLHPSIALTAPPPVFTPSVVIASTELDYTADEDDCYIMSTDTQLKTGTYNIPIGASMEGYRYKCWIPFTVTIPQGSHIITATLILRATYTNASTTVKIRAGCHNAATSTIPPGYYALDGYSFTSHPTYTDGVSAWTSGSDYNIDITLSLQDVVNRTDWVETNNLLGVMIKDAGSFAGARRFFDSYETSSTYCARLNVKYV